MNKPNWFSIFDRGNNTAEILIYDQIGKDWFSQDGISARDFSEALKPHASKDLIVGINSPGGNVFDGWAIGNQLLMHKGHVSTRNDGLVGSIASVIFLAGKTRTVAENSLTMIHDPSGAAAGKAGELRAMADVLDTVKNNLADCYVKASGRGKEDVLRAMAEEKRFTAQEAFDWKFATAITPGLRAVASFDLSMFKNFSTAPDPVAQLRADLTTEKTKRITGEIDNQIQERRILAKDRAWWIAEAVKDETVLDRIKGFQQNLPPEGIQHAPPNEQTPANDFRAYRKQLENFRNPSRK